MPVNQSTLLRRHQQVERPHTFGLDYFADAVNESAKARLLRRLVVDELDLYGLHGGDGENGLGQTGAETAQQTHVRRQVAPLVDGVGLEPLECAEAEDDRIDRTRSVDAYRNADFGMEP
jgi:hypothetical protein